MRVWQVATGDGSRDYADVFLKFGVILVGPGSEGDYFSNKDAYNNPDSWAYRPFIRTLAEDLTNGDIIVLKRRSGSAWEVIAVGEVISDYRHVTVMRRCSVTLTGGICSIAGKFAGRSHLLPL